MSSKLSSKKGKRANHNKLLEGKGQNQENQLIIINL